jgi:hypothetical protein
MNGVRITYELRFGASSALMTAPLRTRRLGRKG